MKGENDCSESKEISSFTIHHFNVYLLNWIFIDEFWAATNWDLPIGGITKYKTGELYNKAVRIKRMS